MSYVYFPSDAEATPKVALYDLDGTLIVSKSGRRYPTSVSDVLFASDDIPQLFEARRRDGWTVAIVTNQSRWSDPDIQSKVSYVLNVLKAINGWTPHCLVSTASHRAKDDPHRKPARGLYDVLLSKMGLTHDAIVETYVCGDAVGSEDEYPPYTWSDSDKKFADAIGARFVRPLDEFPPQRGPPTPPEGTLELVLLVGNPGSGKSTTGRRYMFRGYAHIEQDFFKTGAGTLEAAETALARYKSVVVDATHASRKNRTPYYELAKRYKARVVVYWHARDGRPFNAATRQNPVPEIAYAVYSKHFEDPRDDGVPCYLKIVG